MASAVGRTMSFTPRLSASRVTVSITGNRPYAPVPITKRVHRHGMFSSSERGVWPNASRNFFVHVLGN